MPRNNKSEEKDKNTSPAWMTTYGDMMTLLLVFFVLLYSFSVMDLDKFQGFISSLQAQLGVLDGGKTIVEETAIDRGSRGERFNPSLKNLEKVMGEMKLFVQEQGLDNHVFMELNERGLIINLTGTILYDIAKAKIKVEGEKLLDQIANVIKDIPNAIMVEGHTDNWPINTEEFPSNWELSTTRAVNVVKYLIEEAGIDSVRLSAAGYAEYRPLEANDTAEQRAKNRRVEIVILDSAPFNY